MFQQMDTNRHDIIDSVIQLVYFMRGSVQYGEMMNMTALERRSIAHFIEKRLEGESEKMYPVY